MRNSAIILILLFFSTSSFAQNSIVKIKGIVTNNGQRIENASVGILELNEITFTNVNGYYEINVKQNSTFTIITKQIGYYSNTQKVTTSNEVDLIVNISLEQNLKTFDEVIIQNNEQSKSTLKNIDIKAIKIAVNPSGNIETILKTLPGVVSNNEFSSTYNVRGGNFDENLIYVNDIEVYRPFLVRSGQQEGLSFANVNMVQSLQFSSGGFDAKYGDKMSSVLDIKYRKPTSTNADIELGLLTQAAHIEGNGLKKRLAYQFGVRHRQNAYLLKQLNVNGDYRPRFFDIQTLIYYDVNENFEISYLGNFARNNYLFIPSDRTTDFGLLQEFLRFQVFFEGQEKNRFTTTTNALSANYTINKNNKLKFIISNFNTNEEENNNTLGQYFLGEVETNQNNSNFGNVKFLSGAGSFLNRIRNELNANVLYGEVKGIHTQKTFAHLWGIRLQNENIYDVLNEWQYNDSSGYSLPYNPTNINLPYVLKNTIKLNTYRISGYYQNNWNINDSSIFALSTGVRFNYWTLNKQLTVSPRATFSIMPKWEKKYAFRFSAGVYHQPPFYREIRNIQGTLNPDVLAQRSIHLVGAMERSFIMWRRPFKFTAETYYKFLNSLIPYDVDNVRIRYYATNNSNGYAYGADFKINGEFIKNTESWFSLSYLKTGEDLTNDLYYKYYNKEGEIINSATFNKIRQDSISLNPGFIARPTDQRLTLGIFFQDYIPRYPFIKVNISLIYGSGLPYGPPTQLKYQQIFRARPYRRVDIGSSFELKNENKKLGNKNPFKYCKQIWLNIDVFNVLGIDNVVSYTWVKDNKNRLVSVPNFLSARLINLKLSVNF